jgi:hypothetical protein
MLSRRSLLGLVAAFGAAGGGARAFTLQEASSETTAAYLSACGPRELHDSLIAEINAILGDDSVPEAVKAPLREGVSCPTCGCLVRL